MTRIMLAICAAMSLGFGLSVAAQSSSGLYQKPNPSLQKRPVSVTGCLRQTQDGKYFLTNARIQSQRSMGSSLNSTRNWNLEGGKDLETHLDRQLTITGTPLADVTRQRLKGQTRDTPELKARNFAVKTITKDAGACRE